MTFLQIECFVEAAKEGNISRASKRLFLSQQSVSRYIAALEQELGMQLFERYNKGVKLTPAGQLLFPVWEKIIYENRLALDRARDSYYETAKLLKIGILDSGAYNSYIAEGIARFSEKYPDINVEWEYYLVRDLFENLDQNSLDMVIMFGSELHADHDYRILELSDSFLRTGIYMAKSHPLALRKIRSDLLRGEVMGVLDQETSSDHYEKLCVFLKEHGLTDEVKIRHFRGRQNLATALISKKCITVAFDSLYENYQDRLKFIPLPEYDNLFKLSLVWKDERNDTKGRNLAECFRK